MTFLAACVANALISGAGAFCVTSRPLVGTCGKGLGEVCYFSEAPDKSTTSTQNSRWPVSCETSQWSQETTEHKVWGPGAWDPHSHPLSTCHFISIPTRGHGRVQCGPPAPAGPGTRVLQRNTPTTLAFLSELRLVRARCFNSK